MDREDKGIIVPDVDSNEDFDSDPEVRGQHIKLMHSPFNLFPIRWGVCGVVVVDRTVGYRCTESGQKEPS